MGCEWTGDEIVALTTHDFGFDEGPRRDFRGVAIGQIDERIDIRRLTLQPGAQHQLMLVRRAVHEEPDAAADARGLRAGDGVLLRAHQA